MVRYVTLVRFSVEVDACDKEEAYDILQEWSEAVQEGDTTRLFAVMPFIQKLSAFFMPSHVEKLGSALFDDDM